MRRHIVELQGRKEGHSKVCTSKGPRDRRVRLSAHTAIQFYDVQDRLGYDRASKAVDWLIKNAKSAIDELAELPPWHPHSVEESSSKKPHQDPIFEHTNHIQHQDYAFDVAPEIGQFCAQRGPLQSSNMALLCPWMESIDEEMKQMVVPEVASFGFCFPDGIQGEEVLDDGISEKMSSGFSASYY